MDTITVASVLTQEVEDLSLGEVVQASVVLGLVVLAVLLAFGIKTYVHWRRQLKNAKRIGVAPPAGFTCPGSKGHQHRAPRLDVLSTLGDLRRPETLKRSFEDGK
ncbi:MULTISPECIES: hypothetical protein [Glutamicibacter]|uniref:hypothetical protein n=1 Tax=Glutamicibacter TaxID=1742989 RepID=UPI00093B4678|nr:MULTISPECIES: hypothetical protein [Glutamicibacter]MDV2978519.1 hypothetical protein [Actinomycetes bacterium ARC8]QEP08550.1 hypothetical protein F0M17_15570 [Glutamicibacter sp. ZJUTW]UTM45857.1 hypothetical protein XH9_09725 [Glutamicibacter mysorens]